MYTRYAVYYTPEPGPLATFGAQWLGWDCHSGKEAEYLDLANLPMDVAEISQGPRKYGFHGTIKPPFRLAQDQTADGLERELGHLCVSLAPIALDGLRATRLGRFLALVPLGETQPLAALAARAVRELDHFRAAPSAAELARRRAGGLTQLEEANLISWGYPYVLDAFRFHITLSGPLAPAMADTTLEALQPALSDVLPTPFVIRSLTLMGQDMRGMFHEIRRYPLDGTP